MRSYLTITDTDVEESFLGRVQLSPGLPVSPSRFTARIFRAIVLCTALFWGGTLSAQAPAGQAEQAKPPGQINPIQRLIRGLFGNPPRAGKAVKKPNENPADDDEESSKHLDTSLNSDAELSRDFQSVEKLIEKEDWQAAAEGLQYFLDLDTDTFTRTSEGQWQSLQRLAEIRLGSLPAKGRRIYEQLFAERAADLLNEAVAERSVNQLVDVARRFLYTPAGLQAAKILESLHLDRGDMLRAERWSTRLFLARDSVTQQPSWRLRYARTLAWNGRTDRAKEILQDFSAEDLDRLLSAWGAKDLEDWLSPAAGSGDAEALPELRDWPLPFGTSLHYGRSPAADPILVKQWSRKSSDLWTVREQLDLLSNDLRDTEAAAIPSWIPILVGDKVITRLIGDIKTFDIHTGRATYATNAEKHSAERILSGTIDKIDKNDHRARQILQAARYNGNKGQIGQHPLASLLYRDGVTGLLSSDGETLYVIERNAVLLAQNQYYWWGRSVQQLDALGRDLGTNVLVAYDIESGQRKWEVGGPLMNDLFQFPLAGTYFFGPPTPVGDELYIIGEFESEVRLHVLEKETGHPVLIQPLANSTAKIERDIARRFWPCLPGVSNELIVCPTTTGWYIAVDRQERRLAWAWRYPNRRSSDQRVRFRGMVANYIRPLNERWASSAPIMAGSSVILTPQELPSMDNTHQPSMVCLNLSDGKQRWEVSKDDGLFAVGIDPRNVLIVGSQKIRCVNISDGSIRWTAKLPSHARPSGRGVTRHDSYLLPLSSGSLIEIALEDGSIRSRMQLPEEEPPLGNLLLAESGLISVDPVSVRCFQINESLEAEIAARRAKNPHDLWAALRSAEMHLSNRDYTQALVELHQADQTTDGNEALRTESRQLLQRTLTAAVRENLSEHEAEFQELEALVGDSADLSFYQLAIERALHGHDLEQALEYIQVVLKHPSLWREHVPLDNLSVRFDCWLAGQLQREYESSDEENRALLDQFFRQLVAQVPEAADKDAASESSLERVIAIHPAGMDFVRHAVDQALARGDYAHAEIRLRQFADRLDPAQLTAMRLKLAEGLLNIQQTGLAGSVLAQIQQAAQQNDQSPGETFQALQQQVAAGIQSDRLETIWGQGDLELAYTVARHSPFLPQDVSIHPEDADCFRNHHVEFIPQTNRLRIVNSSGEVYWLVPLRTPLRSIYGQTVGIVTEGSLAFAVWQGVVHALSIPDRRVLWTRPVEMRQSSSNFIRNPLATHETQMYTLDRFPIYWRLQRYRTPTGMIAVARPNYVAVHARRGMTVHDPLSGEILWSLKGFSPETMIYGDQDRIYIIHNDGRPAEVRNVIDGSLQDAGVLNKHLSQGIFLSQNRMVLVDYSNRRSLFGFGRRHAALRCISLKDGKTLWKQKLVGGSHAGWINDSMLAVLSPDGHLTQIDLKTGQADDLGHLPDEQLKKQRGLHLLSDAETIYLTIDQARPGTIIHTSMSSLRIQGYLHAFDRQGSGRLWSRDIQNSNLLLSHFRALPMLVFMKQVHDKKTGRIRIVDLNCLDKRTGEPLLPKKEMVKLDNVHRYQVDLSAPELTLWSNMVRVVIRPKASHASAEPPPAAKPQKDKSAEAPNGS